MPTDKEILAVLIDQFLSLSGGVAPDLAGRLVLHRALSLLKAGRMIGLQRHGAAILLHCYPPRPAQTPSKS